MEWKVSILLYRHALLFSFINSFIYMITFIICFKFMFIQHITVWRQARKAINKHSGSSIQMQATIKYVNSRLLFFICSSFLVMKSTRCVSNQPAIQIKTSIWQVRFDLVRENPTNNTCTCCVWYMCMLHYTTLHLSYKRSYKQE